MWRVGRATTFPVRVLAHSHTQPAVHLIAPCATVSLSGRER
nr:hypothetical protein [Kibdelosporangium sp. MJ126-NF4]CTQ97298.1 hypothetical protein [Kibdelosporangium sp. MJ126-NF4]